MSPTPTTWICHGCGRSVPIRIDACYCGAHRPQAPPRARPSAAAIKLVGILAAMALLVVGIWRYSRDEATPAASRPAQASTQPSAKQATGGGTTTPTSAAAAAAAAEDANAPPLADMVERVMPSIVLVEPSGLRQSGSGFFVSPDLILTNAHVLSNATTAAITSRKGGRVIGQAISVSEHFDLAIIRIPKESSQDLGLPFARSANLRLGQAVVRLGWAQGPSQTSLSSGIVTGQGRDSDVAYIQTTATPNPGDSGGPLLDRLGRVVGVTKGQYTEGNAASGVAIAIDDSLQFLMRIQPAQTQPATAQADTSQAPAPQASAPPPVAPAAPAPAPQSEADARRVQGTKNYDALLAGIEGFAARIDDAWRNYRGQCGITSAPGGQSHEWFALYDPRSPLHQTATYCAKALADIERLTRDIGGTMAEAAEAARRDGVFAGDLRAARARHRLDYAGWDR